MLAWRASKAYTDKDDALEGDDVYSYLGSLDQIIAKLNKISRNFEFSFIFISDSNNRCVFGATDADSVDGTVEIETNEIIPANTTFLKQFKTKDYNKLDWDTLVDKADDLLNNLISASGNNAYDDGDGYWASENNWCNRYLYYSDKLSNTKKLDTLCKDYSKKLPNIEFYWYEDNEEEISEIGYTLTK